MHQFNHKNTVFSGGVDVKEYQQNYLREATSYKSVKEIRKHGL
nr:MAG TPA: hypothetical protein [Caudoviricetes sp.]